MAQRVHEYKVPEMYDDWLERMRTMARSKWVGTNTIRHERSVSWTRSPSNFRLSDYADSEGIDMVDSSEDEDEDEDEDEKLSRTRRR